MRLGATWLAALGAAAVLAVPAAAQVKHSPRPTVPAITADDLRTRLFIFADDSMEGRNTSTPGHERAVAYLEREVRRIGLVPGGENGSYFQTVPFVSRGVDPASTLSVNGRALTLWSEFLPRDQGPMDLQLSGLPVVFGGFWGDSTSLLPASQAAGKLVLLGVSPDSGSPWNRVNRFEISRRFAPAVAIAVAALDSAPADQVAFFKNPGITLPQTAGEGPGYLYVTEGVASSLLGTPLRQARAGAVGTGLTGEIHLRATPRPSRNVIGIIPGSDPALKGSYIAVGAHSDHVGTSPLAQDHDSVRAYNTVIRPKGADDAPREPTAYEARRIAEELGRLRKLHAPRRDTIYNGADDDGSGSVTLLEMAEAMQKARVRPRRSVLFIWHTGEEEGLFGSQWFTDHPTVPLDSIVAQVDVDMVGRGETLAQKDGANLLVIFGSRRVSSEMGDIVDAVNASSPHPFILDYHMDVDGHPEQGYCRSDNWNYNRYAIPTVSPMTGYHIDYHQVSDEPQYINYGQMARIGQFLQSLTVTLGNLDHRLAADHGKRDPAQQCRQ